MRTTFVLLLVLLLQQCGHAESPEEDSLPSGPAGKHKGSKPRVKPGPPPQPPKKVPDPQPKKSDRDRLSQECLNEKYTRLSCSKVFCPPWRRCINGKCVCKLPYQCPRLGRAVCGVNGQSYISFCQAQAIACRTNTAVFSHYGSCDEDVFKVELKKSGDREVVQVETVKGKALICGEKSWDMAAANVICRSLKAEDRGAASIPRMTFKDLEVEHPWPSQCMSVSCTGSEYSLSECTIYEPQDMKENTKIAALTCYKKPQDDDECPEFRCVNEKCILLKHTCDGVDHCGDNSDEMCCKECQSGAFHCKSGVCIPGHAVRDEIRDCLGGDDEVPTAAVGPAQTATDTDSDIEPERGGSHAGVKPDKATGTGSHREPESGGSHAGVKPDKATGTGSHREPESEGSHAEVKPDKGTGSHREPESEGSHAGVKPDKATGTGSHREPESGGSHAEVKPDKGTGSHREPESEGSHAEVKPDKATGSDSDVKPKKASVWWSPKEDIRQARNHTESQVECGIPNFDYFYRTEAEKRPVRRKRVVGGQVALPTQIQWQVAVQEEGKIHCGGVYLGGCWVLTAAHCVRPKPQVFRIKFSLWKKTDPSGTTDSVPVKSIIIHKDYNPRTYQNDIALVQLEELAHSKECLQPNPAVRAVCVPWSTLLFQDGDTCTISGWGRNKEGGTTDALKWANVTVIGNCKSYYKERYFEGMECAGDLDGKVDSCQGDSGGPLVCKDASGLSYVWGIVSWGEKCGEAGYPGVYTKVAHYFEWIRFHTGWPAITKYNH
ncbi:complement factor I-like isoform X6 [Colossoma macropomum]|uniref:complement factor I-like isoform X6 n=1 Tax=Colossoma macropomum TaxID=42526 RepID=UPI001863AD0A|nr:complement factor I-like isoform X6 [Colossoma macropomum]